MIAVRALALAALLVGVLPAIAHSKVIAVDFACLKVVTVSGMAELVTDSVDKTIIVDQYVSSIKHRICNSHGFLFAGYTIGFDCDVAREWRLIGEGKAIERILPAFAKFHRLFSSGGP